MATGLAPNQHTDETGAKCSASGREIVSHNRQAALSGSMMVGSSSPTPVRLSRGDTFHSRKASSGAGFSVRPE